MLSARCARLPRSSSEIVSTRAIVTRAEVVGMVDLTAAIGTTIDTTIKVAIDGGGAVVRLVHWRARISSV